jgi:uncharacterized membrane protein YsdA (DUF1294 family)
VSNYKQKPLTLGQSAVPVYFTLAFLMLMCLAVMTGALPAVILLIYATISLLTFILYWKDKRAAEHGARRTPEITLQSLSLIGGWPGGLFAQRIFHHKSNKKPFQLTYWLVVLINLAGLFAIVSPAPVKFLHSLLEI